MKQYQINLISNASALTSTVTFFLPLFSDFKTISPWQWGCIVVFVASFFIFIKNAIKDRPKTFTKVSDINKYMLKWISNEGRIAIFTRDMSWGNDPKIKPKLLDKSRKKELVIVLPSSTPLTSELSHQGAEILTYNALGYVPESRFTIIRYGRADGKVAVGARNREGEHEIDEYSNGHPFYSTTNDIIEILKRIK